MVFFYLLFYSFKLFAHSPRDHLLQDRYRLLRGTRATQPIAVGFTGGPSRLVKHESPHASNGAKTALHGAAQQAIRIPSSMYFVP
jgi:hypothetical protein